MSIPIGEVGVYGGAGGVIVAVAMKVIPLLFKKVNGRNNGTGPGKADICIKRGEKMVEYDIVIKQLCKGIEESKELAKEAREENNDAHKLIFKKLDELK